MEIIDITREMLTADVYGEDQEPILERRFTVEDGGYNYGVLYTGLHAGTHIDAPLHFLGNGCDVAQLALDGFYGACRVLDLKQEELTSFLGGVATLPKIVLFKGSLHFSLLNAQQLHTKGVVTVGTEGMSVGEVGKEAAGHLAMFNRGLNVIESLDLSKAESGGSYVFVGFPLKISGAEASPIRAVLIKDC